VLNWSLLRTVIRISTSSLCRGRSGSSDKQVGGIKFALPVFVISRVAADAMATEAPVWSVRVSGWGAGPAKALSMLTDFIAVPDQAFDGAALLVTLAKEMSLESVSAALVKAGATVRSAALVGSHATRYTVAADKA